MLMFGKEQQRNDPRSVKDLLNCFLFFFSFPPLVAGSNFSFSHMLNFSSCRLLSNLCLRPIILELLAISYIRYQ